MGKANKRKFISEQHKSTKPKDDKTYRCRKCGEYFAREEMRVYQTKDGERIHKICKTCLKQYNREYRDNHLEKIRLQDRERAREYRKRLKNVTKNHESKN